MRLNSKKINQYINSNKYDFNLFNINYNKNEVDTINNMSLDKSKTYTYFGSIKTLGHSIKYFLSELGTNNKYLVNRMEKIILNILQKVLKGYMMEYFWLDIRVTHPTNSYDISRWHKDGKYFINNDMGQLSMKSKFITVLKGPGTLLIKSTKSINKIYKTINDKEREEKSKFPYNDIKNEYNLVMQHKIGEKYRLIYAKRFDKKQIIQPTNNMGAILFSGDDIMKGALHSEPKKDVPRMFISILPGSKKDIEELKKKMECIIIIFKIIIMLKIIIILKINYL